VIAPHDPRSLFEAMEQNVKKAPGPSKGLLQSEDLYEVLYHSPFFFSFFALLFLFEFSISFFKDVAVYPGD
jgi:hypothetical protein